MFILIKNGILSKLDKIGSPNSDILKRKKKKRGIQAYIDYHISAKNIYDMRANI